MTVGDDFFFLAQFSIFSSTHHELPHFATEQVQEEWFISVIKCFFRDLALLGLWTYFGSNMVLLILTTIISKQQFYYNLGFIARIKQTSFWNVVEKISASDFGFSCLLRSLPVVECPKDSLKFLFDLLSFISLIFTFSTRSPLIGLKYLQILIICGQLWSLTRGSLYVEIWTEVFQVNDVRSL